VLKKIHSVTNIGTPGRDLMETYFSGINLVKWVTNTLSQVYSTGVDRSVSKSGKDAPDDVNTELATMLKAIKLSSKFKTVERYINLLNSSVVQIKYNKWRTSVDLEVFPIHRVFVLQHPDYPNQLDAAYGVALEIDTPANSTEARTRSRFVRYERIDDGAKGWNCDIVNGSGDIITAIAGENTGTGDTPSVPPIPVLPLIKIDAWDTQGEFYPEGNDDIVTEPLAILTMETDRIMSQSYTAHPQYVLTGARDSDSLKDLVVGPGTVSVTGEEEDLKILDAGGNVEVLISAVMKTLKLWLVTRSIPPTELELEPVERSGVAKYQARQPLYEARAEQVPIYEEAETELFNKLGHFLLWLKGGNGDGLPGWALIDWTAYDYSVSINNPAPMLTEQEKQNLWKSKFDNKVASTIDYFMEEQGMELRQAQEKAVEIRQAGSLSLATPDTVAGGLVKDDDG